MKKYNILITGGAGAIGFQLSKALAEAGHQVYIADNFSRSKRDEQFINLIKKIMFMKLI